MKLSKPTLNRLLAGSQGLAGPDKEDVLSQLLEAHGQRRRWWQQPALRWSAGGVALAASVGLVVLLAQPVTSTAEFAARGEARPSFEIACVPNPCREGARVAFRLSNPRGAFFSALVLDKAGDAEWFLSNVDTKALGIDGVLMQAPVLGESHRGASLEVLGVFAQEALDKARLKELAKSTDGVVRRTLVVEP